jgi:hypothetical protein
MSDVPSLPLVISLLKGLLTADPIVVIKKMQELSLLLGRCTNKANPKILRETSRS